MGSLLTPHFRRFPQKGSGVFGEQLFSPKKFWNFSENTKKKKKSHQKILGINLLFEHLLKNFFIDKEGKGSFPNLGEILSFSKIPKTKGGGGALEGTPWYSKLKYLLGTHPCFVWQYLSFVSLGQDMSYFWFSTSIAHKQFDQLCTRRTFSSFCPLCSMKSSSSHS